MPGLRSDSTAVHAKTITPAYQSLGRAPLNPGPSTCIGNLLRSGTTGTCVRWKFWAPPKWPLKLRQSATQDLGTTPSEHGAADKDAVAGYRFSAVKTKLFLSASRWNYSLRRVAKLKNGQCRLPGVEFAAERLPNSGLFPAIWGIWGGLAALDSVGLD